jgi:hypothetical protein
VTYFPAVRPSPRSLEIAHVTQTLFALVWDSHGAVGRLAVLRVQRTKLLLALCAWCFVRGDSGFLPARQADARLDP